MHDVDAGRQLEFLPGEMVRSADAGRAEIHLAGIRLGVTDQLRNVARREIEVGGEGERRMRDHRHRSEVSSGIVLEIAIHRRAHGQRRGRYQQRMSVGRRGGDEFGADGAPGAGAVLDHERLSRRSRQPLGEHSPDDVGSRARRERDDDSYWARRIRLGKRAFGEGRREYNEQLNRCAESRPHRSAGQWPARCAPGSPCASATAPCRSPCTCTPPSRARP